MEQLCHTKARTVYDYTGYTVEEVKVALLKHKPKELWLYPYSQATPICKILEYSENGIGVNFTWSANKGSLFISWNQFYEAIKNYLCPGSQGSGIQFEQFACYEIHVSSRMYGCGKQCKECELEQRLKDTQKEDKK